MWGPMMMTDGNWGWWMFFGGVWTLVFWGAIIGVVVWGISKLSQNNRPPEETPLDIARKRYARGEIDKDQLEDIKRTVA